MVEEATGMLEQVTQRNRLLAIIDTPLDDEVLLLDQFSGVESVSGLFRFELSLLVEHGKASEVKPKKLVGKNVTIRLSLRDGKERYFNGMINFLSENGRDDRFCFYVAQMVPWLWRLTLTSDCRSFQRKTVPEIIKQLFEDLGFNDYRDALTDTYTKLDYCVQYRESYFSFISRIMEMEGIFYFFEHERGKHTLVLADSPEAHRPCPNQPEARHAREGGERGGEDTVRDWIDSKSLRPGTFTTRSHNFQMPRKSFEASEPTRDDIGENSTLEVYDYPGDYSQRFIEPGERLEQVEQEGATLARFRMEEQEARNVQVTGTSNCRAFASGYRFDLTHYPERDSRVPYVLIRVQHFATQKPPYFSGTGTDFEEPYRNGITCIPHAVPFRPPRVTPKPVMLGPQTATVVGKEGEEIWTDKYGRVKVQFHWDRKGERNEHSSCWVRVAQPWAGRNWGAIFIPRIGQEVVATFLEGDPDQPIIVCSLYNADNMPPYGLPEYQTRSTIKSRSSKGGEPDNFNELRFEDKKGKEEVYLHAERELKTVVEAGESRSVGGSRTTTIGKDDEVNVKGQRTIIVETGDQELKVDAGNAALNVAAGQREVNVPAGTYQLTANAVVVTATTDLTLECGAGKININTAGIVTIQGTVVKIN